MKVISWLDDNFEQVLVSFFTMGLVIVLSVNVMLRFIWGYSFSTAEELGRYAFLWAVFWAGSLAAQKNAHIRVTAPTDWLPQHIINYIEAFADIIWLCFNLFVVKEGWTMAMSMFEYPFTSPALDWSMAWVHLIIPLAFGMMSFRILQRYYRIIRYGWQMGSDTDQKADF